MERTVTYRVRPVTRWQVTRHHEETSANGSSGGCDTKGEFDSKHLAIDAMNGFVHFERVPSKIGYPPKMDDVDIPEISWTDVLPEGEPRSA